eukprot:jgi/Botrbrau1/16453/Bobra.0142s0049.1
MMAAGGVARLYVNKLNSTRSLASSIRFFCEGATAAGEDEILGIYTPVTKLLWIERQQRAKLNQGGDLPVQQPVPVPPRPITITYPFSTSYTLREQYRNAWQYVRMGKLLEDLDSLAGNIAFEHCYVEGGRCRAPILVTASVDAIKLKHRLSFDNDLSVTGKVVWTGRSSMDILMELRQAHHQHDVSLAALFTFVARDPVTGQAMPVNPLVPGNPEEEALFRERQQIAELRRAERSRPSLSPEPHEAKRAREWADELLSEGRTLIDLPALSDGTTMLIRDTACQNIFIAQPQQRNLSGRIFGGFLMRRAFELAFSAVYLFAGYRPIFVSVDEVTFVQPVDVGSLVRFRAHVVHTEHDPASGTGYVHVEVTASVTMPEKRQSDVTNTFNFVYRVHMAGDAEEGGCRRLKRVLPATLEEARRLIKYCPEPGHRMSPALERAGLLKPAPAPDPVDG